MSLTNSDSPVFIVGMPRSGTTLLRALLTAHPDIAIAPETHYIKRFVEPMKERSIVGREEFENFWRSLSRSDRFGNLGIDPSETRRTIVRSGDFSYANIFASILKRYAEERQKPRWGEKTPNHHEHVLTLLSWFPTARVVYVLRDPRGVCSSLTSVYWRTHDGRGFRSVESRSMMRLRRVFHDATIWQRQADRIERTLSREPRIKLLKYEDLVTDPSRILREVFHFLGARFHEEIISSRSWADVSVHPPEVLHGLQGEWRREHYDRSISPISTDFIDKWKHELSTTEVQCIERLCESGMKLFGYDPVSREPESPLRRIKEAAARAWCSGYWELVGY